MQANENYYYYIIENTLAKGVDSVSPIFKGVEILPDGSVARFGTNYSGKFQEAHDASKASIQSRISNLESGGVKGTGDIPKGYYQDVNGKWHRPDGGYASNKEVGLPEPSGSTKRLEYMGSTPSKASRTGKEVIERMKNEDPPKIRTVRGKTEFLDGNNKWRPLSEADMAHKIDAVTWWNEVGRKYGPKSKEVRDWMLDPDNYYLEHYSKNRSEGASLGQTYLPPDN
ncbi:GH-E family nuclease [Bacillus sp. CD3-1a]|uniref:GH-E family nuclease n=1 Tax=Bacillus sp. CD3-1a TaxID=2587158 RepID=UPI00111F6343|nr:GH-E family nuclease [Bacillus sp. CD3-1a]TNO98509.1 hypothetical protein FH038_04215 [Bacillus sp. CD3-1a]